MAAKKSSKKNPPVREQRYKVVSGGTSQKNNRRKNTARQSNPQQHAVMLSLIPCLLVLVSFFVLLCFLSESATGLIGRLVRQLLYGLFGGGAYAVPALIVLTAIFWRRDYAAYNLHLRFIFSSIVLLFLSVLLYHAGRKDDVLNLAAFWANGQLRIGGGAVGGLAGWFLLKVIGTVGSMILTIVCLAIFGIFLFGLTPQTIWNWCTEQIRAVREDHRVLREEQRAQLQKQQQMQQKKMPPASAQPVQQPKDSKKRRGHSIDINVNDDAEYEDNMQTSADLNGMENSDVTLSDRFSGTETVLDDSHISSASDDGRSSEFDVDLPAQPDDTEDTADDVPLIRRHPLDNQEPDAPEAEPVIDTAIFDELMRRQREEDALSGKVESIAPVVPNHTAPDENPISDEILRRVAGEKEQPDSASLNVERQRAVPDAPTAAAEPQKPVYQFPPLTLLDTGKQPNNADVTEELQTTARRLVETLNSFKVRTRIVNVSRGPTITRYELAPEEGVRVRSIVNLVDDISLNLATTGVRIEAPIPGKQAVGIEVPNRVVATVYLRRMLENPKFAQAPSFINVSLGEDVAGDPVYLDIAKMPHLLIAGTTGSGKSVCINSMIVSLLYKASPDDVKLILIDPKKVEFNIYNGLPHLLVPIVSDPKKAAGSLQWAVGEMERRFTILEDSGVRDLKSYNKVRREHPEYEALPQIVIIIDELADLMMTAPDDVEESICRLAQKARAAGMHLIIGTQRPSVDVITGLIKANVPSRIAFTVSSQIDSRTILDVTGAEKLIGHGDMLYAPIGVTKPIRVQGAFVSGEEIDRVLDFIKSHFGVSEYDEQVIDSIEREAARCGQSKKGSASIDAGEDGEDADPMLKPAIELAVESGKISTSLIQRRLSLGYGRAAKLIDRMEQMGIVSAPEGQKPRSVLITKQQYMEMILNHDGES